MKLKVYNLWNWKKFDRQLNVLEFWFPKNSGVYSLTILNIAFVLE